MGGANISALHSVCTGCLDHKNLRGDEFGLDLLQKIWGRNGVSQTRLLEWREQEDDWYKKEKKRKEKTFLDQASEREDKEGHFIRYIYVKDQDDLVVFIKNLSFIETESPAFSFWVPLGTETLRPFSLCNVHGTWEGEQFNLSEANKTGDLERDCIAEKNIASKKK